MFGDGACGNIRRKSDSAFVTREFTVCLCDTCVAKGARDLFNGLQETVAAQKMSPFVDVKSIRLKANHPGDGSYLTLDGLRIDADSLEEHLHQIRSVSHS